MGGCLVCVVHCVGGAGWTRCTTCFANPAVDVGLFFRFVIQSEHAIQQQANQAVPTRSPKDSEKLR